MLMYTPLRTEQQLSVCFYKPLREELADTTAFVEVKRNKKAQWAFIWFKTLFMLLI